MYVDGAIYILLVSFKEKKVCIYQCSQDMDNTVLIVELPLNIVKDCYNLKIDGNPLMLTRQGGENRFQIIWPDQVEFDIGVRETFCFKRDDKLYFSEWHEDPDYREEINIREYSTGRLLEKIEGAEMTLPNGQSWILR